MRYLTLAILVFAAFAALLVVISASSSQDQPLVAHPFSTAVAVPNNIPVHESDITLSLLPTALDLDSQAGRLYVANNRIGKEGALYVIDTFTRQIVATVPVGTSPDAIAVDKEHQMVYVMNRGSDNLTVVDMRTNTAVDTVAVGHHPQAMALDAESQRLYVVNRKSNDLSVIDLTSRREIQRIEVGQTPFILAVDPIAHTIFVLCEGDNSVYQVNLSNGRAVQVAHQLELHGSKVNVALTQVAVNVATHKVYLTHKGGLSVLDAHTGKTVADIALPSVGPLAVDSIRNVAYAAGQDRLFVIDGATRVVRYIPLQHKPTNFLVDVPNQRVYATHWNHGIISIVDSKTGWVDAVPVGQNPNALAVDDMTNQVYVVNTNWAADGNHQPGSVSIIDFQPYRSMKDANQRNAGIQRLGVNLAGYSWDSLDRTSDLYIDYVLMPIAWADIEPQRGQYDWDRLDVILGRTRNYGLRTALRIYRAPAWARMAGSSLTASPTNPDDLRAFMQALVARYGTQFEGYIIWNEPNLPEEWGGNQPSASSYVNLLSAAYDGAKAANPAAVIVSAGLAPTQGGNGAVNDLTFLQAMYTAGLTRTVDIVGMNGLGFAYAPDDTSDPNGLNFSRLAALRQVMVNHDHADGVAWALEVGWLQDTAVDLGGYNWMKIPPHLQGPYILRAIQKAEQEWPWLTGLFLWNGDYDLVTPVTDQKHWFALNDWSRYLMGWTQEPVFTRPIACGVTNQTRPIFEGTSIGAMTTTLLIDGTPAYTTTPDVAFHFVVTPTEDLSAGQHIISVQPEDYWWLQSKGLTLTINSTLPFDPLGVVLTYRYPGATWEGVRIPRNVAGCVDPSNWRLSLSPGAITTVTVPVSCAATPVVTFTYGTQTIQLTHSGESLYQGVFTPAPHDVGNFVIAVRCGANIVTQTGVALIDPDGVVYDSKLGLSHPISGATVVCEQQVNYDQWVIWDAWNYAVGGKPQVNPQITSQDGYFSFLTPRGTYRLRVTHNDYFDSQSGALIVVDEPVHHNVPMQKKYKVYLPLVLR